MSNSIIRQETIAIRLKILHEVQMRHPSSFYNEDQIRRLTLTPVYNHTSNVMRNLLLAIEMNKDFPFNVFYIPSASPIMGAQTLAEKE